MINASVEVVCYKSKKLANGSFPLILRICKDGKNTYKRIQTIQPGYVNTISFPIQLRNNYRFKDIAIEKVRFSDGTIKEY